MLLATEMCCVWSCLGSPRDIPQDLEEALDSSPLHATTLPSNSTRQHAVPTDPNSTSSSSSTTQHPGDTASVQIDVHRKKPTTGVNVGVVVAVLAVVLLIVLVVIGVLKEHRFIRFQSWRLLQAGERDTTIGVKPNSGTTTQREVDKEKRKKKKKKKKMTPQKKLQSLLGPSNLGFSRLKTYDSNSEDEEFPVFNRV